MCGRGLRKCVGLRWRSVSLSPLLEVQGTGSSGRGQRDALSRRDLPVPPPPCHPQSGPSQSGDLETRVAGDSVVSAKTLSSPNGKDPQLDLRNSPRGPSPNLSPALTLSPRFKAPGTGPLLEGALRGGRSTTPPGWPLGGQDPGERRALLFFPPPGSPLLP